MSRPNKDPGENTWKGAARQIAAGLRQGLPHIMVVVHPVLSADEWKNRAEHIFVEQDRSNLPILEAIRISYRYLKDSRVA